MTSNNDPESTKQDFDALYAQIDAEWRGENRHEGLYLIAMDESDGDELEARLFYVKKRLLQLTEVD